MVAIHIEHKLDAGTLTISLTDIEIAPDETDGNPGLVDTFQFRFECNATGAWFDADISRADMVRLCPILGEYDEMFDTLNEPPTIADVSLNQNIIWAMFTAAGRNRTYPVNIKLTRRTYEPDKQGIMELKAENSVLRRKVASLEDDLGDLRDRCDWALANIARLAILTNRSYAPKPIMLPDGNMSDDALIQMMKPICEYCDAIDPTLFFDADHKSIMRAIDRGVDPNTIVGPIGNKLGMPLLFRVFQSAHLDTNLPDNLRSKIARFNDILKLIEYLLEAGLDVNTKYNDETILTRFIGYNAAYIAYANADETLNTLSHVSIECMIQLMDSKHYSADKVLSKCIEYVEVRDAIIKTLRDAGAK